MTSKRTLPVFVFFLLLGALHSLSFAPDPLPTRVLPYLELITLAILIYQLNQRPLWSARFKVALAFGLGNFALGLYWVFISLHVYGELPSFLAGLAVLLFAATLSLFYVAIALLQLWFSPASPPRQGGQALINALLWASLWTLLEWFRGTFLTGFPWLNIGYAHLDGPLAGWAPVLGAYGVGWMAVFTAAALANFFQLHRHPEKQSSQPKAPGWQTNIVLILAFILNLGALFLHGWTWSDPKGEPFFVRLTQGNVPQSMKFDPQRFEEGVQTYYELASLPPKEDSAAPQLIILPETVVPVFQDRLPAEFWQRWTQLAQTQDSTLIMGLPLFQHPDTEDSQPAAASRQQGHYTNSAVAIDGTTTAWDIMQLNLRHRYDKHHLVPFGEFVPPGFGWFIELLNIPLGNFQRGTLGQPPFELLNQHIAPDICYEDVFGEEIIQSVRPQANGQAGASLLVNLSNLGWFGDTWALRQHLQISRMRALETARPMLRATNTGMTAVIDPDGLVRALLPQHTVGVLDVEVQGFEGLTPYVRWGNIIVLGLSLLLIAILGPSHRRQRFKTSA